MERSTSPRPLGAELYALLGSFYTGDASFLNPWHDRGEVPIVVGDDHETAAARQPLSQAGHVIVGELSRARLVVFMVEAARYAVPLSTVERAYAMAAVSPLPGAPPAVLGMINLHGRPLAVVDPRRRLGLAPREYGPAAHLLIARTPRRTLAIPTDEVLGVVELEGAAVTPVASVAPGLPPAGIAALPDGLLLIHDLDAFFTPEEEAQIDRALEARG